MVENVLGMQGLTFALAPLNTQETTVKQAVSSDCHVMNTKPN